MTRHEKGTRVIVDEGLMFGYKTKLSEGTIERFSKKWDGYEISLDSYKDEGTYLAGEEWIVKVIED